MRTRILFVFLFAALSASAADISLRDALKEQLFEELNAALQRANDADAAVLTPETYRRGGETYKRADESFARGADVDRVRKTVSEATKLFDDAATMAPTVESFVSAAYQARQDAMEAEAKERVPDMWLAAEQALYEATSRAEKGRERRVDRYADKAETLFRDAELAAIEKVLFTQIDTEIANAKSMDADDWAPRSYRKAIDLLKQAREVLASNRYDTDEPRNLARQAMHSALHAQYVARAADDIDDNDLSVEDLLMQWEDVLRPLGDKVDVPMYFDAGPSDSIELVIAAVEERGNRIAQLEQDAGTLRQRLRVVEEELLLAQGQLENSEAAQARLDRRLAEQQSRERVIGRVERMFEPNEAEVVRAENRLVIRLVGLGFASGSAALETRHEALLAKLEAALAEFPETPITIEGHTDSYGADADNLALSIRRADAVAAHLLERMPLKQSQLTAVGFGETRPIANNETADGRWKNRRIDVVIYPSWWAQ